MTIKTKFLNSILKSAQQHDVAMPWTRGPARRASIARRRGQKIVALPTVIAKHA